MSKLAILLATYNGEKYIKDLLDSLLNQTYEDFTVYIHDDGSTDCTREIIKAWSLKYPTKFVRLGGDVVGGAKKHFLWMLSQMIDADYYMFCDQDDVWLEDKVTRTITAIKALEESDVQLKEKKPALVFSDMYVTDEKLEVTGNSFLATIGRIGTRKGFSQVVIDNPAAGCTMCFNRALRDIVVKAKDIDINNIPMHDAYVLALADIYGHTAFIDEPLVYYRQTGHNEMGAKHETGFQKLCRNLKDIFSGRVKTEKNNFINEARMFAAEIVRASEQLGDNPASIHLDEYELKEYIDSAKDKIEILDEFTRIGDFPKPQRIYFYLKNNFTRAHGTLWMLLWI